MHPFFRPWADRDCNRCPRAMGLYSRIISLPLYPSLTMEQIQHVTDSVKDIAAQHSRRQLVAAGM
jgi:dTDP-4-amino-4,6-dideoxygalactose transaminase